MSFEKLGSNMRLEKQLHLTSFRAFTPTKHYYNDPLKDKSFNDNHQAEVRRVRQEAKIFKSAEFSKNYYFV
jgi:hypothetical protein